MARQEADHQTIQVLHEYDGVDYNLIFIDPQTGTKLTTIGLPKGQMIELVTAIVGHLGGHTSAY